jgi:hypothetical protein
MTPKCLKKKKECPHLPNWMILHQRRCVVVRINVKGNAMSMWALRTISLPSLAAGLIILGVLVFCIFISFLVNWKQLMENFTYNMWGVKT